MSDIHNIAALLRRGGIGNVPKSDLRILREAADGMTATERVRLRFPCGDSIILGPIDRLWEMLGREPTRDEYLAMADLAREAVTYCEKAAKERDE